MYLNVYLRIYVYLQEVEDYDNYVYNLTESNQSLISKPNWFKLYSFKKMHIMFNHLALKILVYW